MHLNYLLVLCYSAAACEADELHVCPGKAVGLLPLAEGRGLLHVLSQAS